MSYHFYIYYKVPAERAAAVRSAAESLQQGIAAATGIHGKLMCRRDKPDTWMETYEGVSEAESFQRLLEAELDRVRFAEALGPDAKRMTELFRPL